jgi:hypothetical protein
MDPARTEILDGMVGSPMAEFELVGISTHG